MYRQNIVASFLLIVGIGFYEQSASAQQLTIVDVPFTPRAVTLVYDPLTGGLSGNSGGEPVGHLEILSREGNFNYSSLPCFGLPKPGLPCRSSSRVLFLEVGNEIESIDPPLEYAAGMTPSGVVDDLSVSGSFGISNEFVDLDEFVASSPHLFIVPETRSNGLTFLGLAILIRSLQSRRRKA